MTRICILGNSHVAALKQAWTTTAAAAPQVQITFFAARSVVTEHLVVRNGQLQAHRAALKAQIRLTSGGKDRIDPAEYDLFVIYGTLRCGLDGGRTQDYSAAFAERAALDQARGSLMYVHVTRLRQITDKPIYAAMAPLPAWDQDQAPVTLPALQAAQALIARDVLAPLGATLIPQPAETLQDGLATQATFTTGSVRLDDAKKGANPHPGNEIRHMNSAYGDIWLRRFLDTVAAA